MKKDKNRDNSGESPIWGYRTKGVRKLARIARKGGIDRTGANKGRSMRNIHPGMLLLQTKTDLKERESNEHADAIEGERARERKIDPGRWWR